MKKMTRNLNCRGRRWPVLLVLMLAFLLLPAAAQAAKDFTVTGGSEDTDYTYTDAGLLTLLKGREYTISMNAGAAATTNQIRVDSAGVYADGGTIKLKLENLNMRANEDNIEFINTDSIDSEISAEFTVSGENNITSDKQNIRLAGKVNTTISGNGILNLTSTDDHGSEFTPSSFTLNSENVTVTMDNISLKTSDKINIKAGTLNITASNSFNNLDRSCIYTDSEFIMSGGTLTLKNNTKYPCITITDDKPGFGLEFSGGKANLSGVSGTSDLILFNTDSAINQKNFLISGGTVELIHSSNYAAIKIGGSSGSGQICNFTVSGGKLKIKTSRYAEGILRNRGSLYLQFSGGETEINTAYQAISKSSSLTFNSSYIHKNYTGDSESARKLTADGSVVNSNGTSKKYVLITPIYNITYDPNGGSLPSGNPESYTRGDPSFTLINPDDDSFLGWTGSNGDTPQLSVSIPLEGVTGDLSFTANYSQQSSYTVTITQGTNMNRSETSGAAEQTVSGKIDDVVYTAADGWYFPDNYAEGVTYAPAASGISVTRDSASQITVSGTPTADVTITLPAASEKQKEATPNAVFNASGTESGTLTGVKAGMQYSLDGGTTWINITGTSVDIPSGVTTANGVLVITRGDATTLDSDQQTIEITKAEKPTGISPAADGELDGVTTAMEYRKSDETGWTAVTESGKITGLASGTYLVRVKANGTILASEPVEVTIKGTIAATVTGYDGVYDGDPHGITVNVTSPASGAVIKYGTSQDSCTLDKSPQIIAEGSLTVYYVITADGYEPLAGSAEVKISKPAESRPDYELFVIGGTFGTDYTYERGVLTFLKGGAYTVTMAPGVETTTHQIKIMGDSIYDDPDHDHKITLTLSDLNMTISGDVKTNNIYIIDSAEKINDITFDIQGTNVITNRTKGGCIRSYTNASDLTFTGNGTLTLDTDTVSGYDGVVNSRNFTMDSPSLNIEMKSASVLGTDGIYINDGKINITSHADCFETYGEFRMTGGEVLAVSTAEEHCIMLNGNFGSKEMPGPGLEISGDAKVTLKTTGTSSANGAIYVWGPQNTNDKSILIDTTETVNIINDGTSVDAGIYLTGEKAKNITMSGGTLVINGFKTGIWRHDSTGYIGFKGGETEITDTENKAIFTDGQTGADPSLTMVYWAQDYGHKNYAGDSAGDNEEIGDDPLGNDHHFEFKYVLITPAARIKYNLNGGTLPAGISNPERYSRVDSFTLTNPTRGGYDFKGWTGTGLTGMVKEVSIPIAGITGDLSFTANWKEPKPAASFTAEGPDNGTLTNVTDGMEYSLDGGTTWTDITGTSAVIPSGITTEKEILVRRKGTETTTESDLQIIHVTKAETPTSVTAEDCTDPSNNDGSLSSVTAEMEYRKPGLNEWIPGDGSKITGLGPGTYQVRVKADGPVLASDPQELTINAKTVVPKKSIITLSEFTATYDGKDHGITVSAYGPVSDSVIKYGTEEGSCSLDGSPVIRNASDSPLKVYYKVNAEEYDTLNGSAKITLNKDGSCVKVPPKAIDRIWDGTVKPLLTDDGEACGGRLLYALGSDDGKAPDADAFTEVIPSKADAGTWYACYKIAGDVNHKDSVPVCLPVTITKVFTVTVTTDGNGTAKASLSKIISKGPDETQVSGPTDTEVFLYKEPNPGYQFRTWQVEPETGTLSGDTYIIGNADVTITAFFEASEPGPEPEPDWPPFFLLDEELPLTGITGPKASPRSGMVPSMRYKPVNMELLIPELNIVSPIVTVPKTDEGYPVLELGDNAGLLEGSALPGSGISVIAAHNTLNTEEYGPFALIRELSEGDVFFVRRPNGNLVRFTVYLNEKIGSADMNALRQAASLYGNTLTLLTCEDELPEGGYASRRIVAAKLTEE